MWRVQTACLIGQLLLCEPSLPGSSSSQRPPEAVDSATVRGACGVQPVTLGRPPALSAGGSGAAEARRPRAPRLSHAREAAAHPHFRKRGPQLQLTSCGQAPTDSASVLCVFLALSAAKGLLQLSFCCRLPRAAVLAGCSLPRLPATHRHQVSQQHCGRLAARQPMCWPLPHGLGMCMRYIQPCPKGRTH